MKMSNHMSLVCHYLEVAQLSYLAMLENILIIILTHQFHKTDRASPWSGGSVLEYRSLLPVFGSRRGHI